MQEYKDLTALKGRKGCKVCVGLEEIKETLVRLDLEEIQERLDLRDFEDCADLQAIKVTLEQLVLLEATEHKDYRVFVVLKETRANKDRKGNKDRKENKDLQDQLAQTERTELTVPKDQKATKAIQEHKYSFL
jgi:hypothetical protein